MTKMLPRFEIRPLTEAEGGGQWRQRVPKSLHAALARRAEKEGVSLNALVTAILAESLGRRSVDNHDHS
jgi:antitoxin HicB